MISKYTKLFPIEQLFLAALTFTLGVGIARYLGYPINTGILVVGFLTSIFLQATGLFLAEYFRLPMLPLEKDESLSQREKVRQNLLIISLGILALSLTLIFEMQVQRLLRFPAGILFALMLVVFIIFAVPPGRLAARGYGELVSAFYLGAFLPTFAFILESGIFHRLLAFTTLALTLLAIAFFIIKDFTTFAQDQNNSISTLLVRITWQKAVPIHHILVLIPFLLFLFAPSFNFPRGIIWPVFIAFPFAIGQIILLQSIANGGRALWNVITNLALVTFGLSVYLLTITFWVN
jgi:1,4-dihydroxy-2-naphthoate octaprenyltransferase